MVPPRSKKVYSIGIARPYGLYGLLAGSSDDTGSARPLLAFNAKRPLSRVKNGLLPNQAALLIWLYSTSPKASTLSFRRKVPLA